MDIHFLLNLNSHDLILTPNQRLANTLHRFLEKHKDLQGERAYLPPTIISFSQFIRQLWNSYLFILPKKILSYEEEIWLWRKIICQSPISPDLLNPNQSAYLIQKAWHDLKQWNLNLDSLSLYQDNENIYYFKIWSEAFIKICQEKKHIDESSALECYSKNIEFLNKLAYKNIYFYHFIELTPLQNLFKNALQKTAHLNIIIQPLAEKDKNAFCQKFNSKKEEMIAMVNWAKKHYAHHPNLSIGCVVPHLNQQRNEILRQFKSIFNTDNPPIDISAGAALSDYKIIGHTLLFISLLSKKFDYEIFSDWLRSPYLKLAEKEIFKRHELDALLRNRCKKTSSLKEILSIEESIEIHPLLTTINDFNLEEKTLLEWSQNWLDLLKETGWPGQRNLNSIEYQAVNRFIKKLEEIQSFSSIQISWTWKEFSSLIKTICQETIFQAESEKTSIQVLGLLEAAGLCFDEIWIMGLDDKTWPSASSPNPFLPYELQKKYHMPNANPEREYLYCQEILNQLLKGSKKTILSYAIYDEDKELQPSPFIHSFPYLENQVNLHLEKREEVILEEIEDEMAPIISNQELISGGSNIVQYQAECPFKAFSTLRLHALALNQPMNTPDYIERGNATHKALEIIWKKIPSSNHLLKLSSEALEKHIDQSISQVYKKNIQGNKFLIELEKIRLKKILYAWLDIEKKRCPFTVIAIEDQRQYQYKNITLRLRIDRIDQDEHGYIIIDYKTGKKEIKNCFGQRIKEPQLPLYCLSYNNPISTLCFGQLRLNDLSLNGISEKKQENNHKNIDIICYEEFKSDFKEYSWPDQIITWKNNIHYLLDEFLSGKSSVDPLEKTTCTHCHLHSLCRIFENEPNY